MVIAIYSNNKIAIKVITMNVFVVTLLYIKINKKDNIYSDS